MQRKKPGALRSGTSMSDKKIKVAIADQNPIVIYGLRALLREEHDIEVVFTSSTAQDLFKKLVMYEADIIICDSNFTESLDTKGTQLLRSIHRYIPHINIVFYSANLTSHQIAEAMEAGAASVIRKSEEDLSLIVHTLRRVHNGSFYLQPSISHEILSSFLSGRQKNSSWHSLSAREKVVIQLICEGHSIKQIAHELCKSPKTISNQKTMAMRKLGAANDIQLINRVKELRYELAADPKEENKQA
ncbi:response regulator transcription factor [Chimaeribacter arupi]|uniref:DNA-binding response regulator n=2 Tax=Yersiniaceae TaxID=1903411 RepID=A0A2N5EJ81_9GAMM|nr:MULTISPECIES: response regulator transcription factor [Yersiniaceae]MBS0969155.1 response regulator transcription factor [Nissabacter archeti]MDV5141583.1 response regulator transcription factor [Chimaeribacter arupi]PLR31241.1 DNA-binding response regulator [Chimaeribacter arupi]PLR45462.1 DNA-binding response regulator [Chimaeribacter arupi]PLR52090.1 DNA-binding response regulator [Chimaeribacter arupi]